jgi:predicted transcriptional regulator
MMENEKMTNDAIVEQEAGEIATREEENSPEALELLKKGEADIKAGRLTRHADVVKAVRKSRRSA